MRSNTIFAAPLSTAFLPIADDKRLSEIRDLELTAQPFYEWFHSEYKYSRLKLMGGTFGIGLAVVSCFSAFPLGQSFGTVVADALHAGEWGKVALQTAFGVAAYTPTAILVSFPNYHEFRELTAQIFCQPQLPTRKDWKKLRMAAMAFARFNSALAGLPFYYLMNKYLNYVPVIKYVFPGTALIGGYMATISVERMIVEDIFLKYARQEAEQIKSARLRLQNRTRHTIKLVTKMTKPELVVLAARIKAHIDAEKFFEDDILAILKILLNDIPAENSDIENYEVLADADMLHEARASTPPSRLVRTGIDILSAAMGATANYVLYAVAKGGAQLFLDYFNVKDEAVDNSVDVALAAIATVPNMFFSAAYAQQDARRAYDAVTNGYYLPGIQSSSAHLISAFSAVPETYIAIEAAENNLLKAIVAATFIGTTMARALAFNMLLDTIIHACNKKSSRALRAEIRTMLTRLERAILMLEPQQLLAVDAALSDKPPELETIILENGSEENTDNEYSYTESMPSPVSEEKSFDSPLMPAEIIVTQALIDGVTPSPFPLTTPDEEPTPHAHVIRHGRQNFFLRLPASSTIGEESAVDADIRSFSAPPSAGKIPDSAISETRTRSNSVPLLFKSKSMGHFDYSPLSPSHASASRGMSSLMVSYNRPSASPSSNMFESSVRSEDYDYRRKRR